MALPVIDNFNRANESPLGGNWSSIPGIVGAATLTNNAMTSPGYYYGSYWNAETTTSNCQVGFKLTTVDDPGPNIALRLNVALLNTYLLYIGTTEWFFIRVDGGVSTFFTPQARTFVNGTVVKFIITGSTLMASFDGVLDAYSVTDTTYTAGGYAGMLFQTANQVADNFYLSNLNTKINIGDVWKNVIDTKIKIDTNLLDYSDWGLSPFTGSTTGWLEIVLRAKNYRELDTDMFGNQTYIWKTSGTSAANYGGINYPTTATGNYLKSCAIVDDTKTYRTSIWVKRKNITSTSNFYMGNRTYLSNGDYTSLVRRSDGILYYFTSLSNANLNSFMPENTWRLMVAYVRPVTPLLTSADANYYFKILDTNGGTVASANYNWQFYSGNTTNSYMAIQIQAPYNATTGDTCFQFCYPRIDLIDGTEPSIETLLAGEGPWRTVTTAQVNVGDVWKNTT